MADDQGGDLHRLGEQLENLSMGSAGTRDEDGNIAPVLGREGNVFYGPYLALPPGQYSVRMIFASGLPAGTEFSDPGLVLEAVRDLQIVAAFPLDEASLEAGVVALPFSLSAEAGAAEPRPVEIRLQSRGECPLLVTSIDLRRMTSAFQHFPKRDAP
jgi:hypothetical protein